MKRRHIEKLMTAYIACLKLNCSNNPCTGLNSEYIKTMNISFTHEQLLDLLHESPIFRGIYLNLTHNRLDEWREKIKSKFPDFLTGAKSPAIKWLRDGLRGKNELLKLFQSEGYNSCYIDGSENETIGIADGKRFAESCF